MGVSFLLKLGQKSQHLSVTFLCPSLPEVLLKEFLVKDHIKNNNFFPYPQIISLEWDGMIRNDAHKKITLKLENKKLIYSFELKYANLLPNSTITPQDHTLHFSDYKTTQIKGEIPLDQFLI